jgi:hypothetical protein
MSGISSQAQACDMARKSDQLEVIFGMFSSEVVVEERGRPSEPTPNIIRISRTFADFGGVPTFSNIQAIRHRDLPNGITKKAQTGLLGALQTKPITYAPYSAGCRVLEGSASER